MNKDSKHAFLIGCFQYPEYLKNLIESLDSPRSTFYVHVNKRNIEEFSEVIKDMNKLPNVHFVESIEVNWGGFSLLQSLKIMLENALKDNRNEFFHFITGQDALCCPLEIVFDFFDNNCDSNFIQASSFINDNKTKLSYIKYYHLYDYLNVRKFWGNLMERIFVRIQMLLGFNRTLPFPKMYKGSGWFSLNKKGSMALYHEMKAKDFEKWKYTYASEEIFIHSVLNNCKEDLHLVFNDHRFIDWRRTGKTRPATLDINYYDEIIKSDAFFCRKIDPVVSKDLLIKLRDYCQDITNHVCPVKVPDGLYKV